MNREEIEKLLGGYSTGTLNPEERRALYEAALEDQQLFESLLGEEPLRELLSDPAVRAHLLAALEEKQPTRWTAVAGWLRRPAIASLAASAAVGIAVLAIWLPTRQPPRQPVQIAHVARQPVEPPEPKPAAKPPAAASARRVTTPKAKAERDPSLRPAEPQPPTEGRLGVFGGAAPAARELYYQSSVPQMTALEVRRDSAAMPRERAAARVPSAASAHLGLRYSILLQNAAGEFVQANPTRTFLATDWLRLLFEPNDAGYLYVLERESSGGGSRLLFGGPVEARTKYSVPAAGALNYPQPGVKELFVLMARQPQSRIADMRTAQVETLADRGRDDQLVQRVPAGEDAVYAVSTGYPSDMQRLALEIRIDIR